ncbi:MULTISPECIES: DUF167 family protein [Rhodomicrobium]|uniref:DUF167 family protein n=1 Tax=Rhodomicrobium TaxID=1068 RepID=UPI000B4A9A58|nr:MULTISPECIES: DUF167 family protein [Rhodomicrobium]
MTGAPGDPLPARRTAEGIVLAVRLTPKAGSDAVTGVEIMDDGLAMLKARVRAAPEKGKANAALVALIADWLDQPKSKAELVTGGKSRLKQILVRGDTGGLMDRLAAKLAALKSGEHHG